MEATSQYVDDTSPETPNLYRFTYRITITNNSTSKSFVVSQFDLDISADKECPYQILGRQYTFNSASGQRNVLPRGSPGIVGCTPILYPGQTFQYASGVDIDAPLGSVSGVLHTISKTSQPKRSEEEAFDVLVSPFSLIAPSAIREYHSTTGMV